jgi:hypothetical protein
MHPTRYQSRTAIRNGAKNGVGIRMNRKPVQLDLPAGNWQEIGLSENLASALNANQGWLASEKLIQNTIEKCVGVINVVTKSGTMVADSCPPDATQRARHFDSCSRKTEWSSRRIVLMVWRPPIFSSL